MTRRDLQLVGERYGATGWPAWRVDQDRRKRLRLFDRVLVFAWCGFALALFGLLCLRAWS